MVRQVLAGGAPRQAARGASEKAQHIHHPRHLVLEHPLIGLAAVHGLEPGELLALALDAVGQFQQHAGAIAGRGLRPRCERLIRRRYRAVELLARALAQATFGLTGGRVEDLLFRAFARHEFAVD
jgi:hypothetical protein